MWVGSGLAICGVAGSSSVVTAGEGGPLSGSAATGWRRRRRAFRSHHTIRKSSALTDRRRPAPEMARDCTRTSMSPRVMALSGEVTWMSKSNSPDRRVLIGISRSLGPGCRVTISGLGPVNSSSPLSSVSSTRSGWGYPLRTTRGIAVSCEVVVKAWLSGSTTSSVTVVMLRSTSSRMACASSLLRSFDGTRSSSVCRESAVRSSPSSVRRPSTRLEVVASWLLRGVLPPAVRRSTGGAGAGPKPDSSSNRALMVTARSGPGVAMAPRSVLTKALPRSMSGPRRT